MTYAFVAVDDGGLSVDEAEHVPFRTSDNARAAADAMVSADKRMLCAGTIEELTSLSGRVGLRLLSLMRSPIANDEEAQNCAGN